VSPALILLVAAAQAAGPAGPAPAPATVSSTDVEIAIAAAAPEAATSVREDLEDLLARRGLAARYRRLAAVDRDEVLRPAAEAPCALACIWVDLGVAKAGRAFVYISATASEQVVIRSLPLPGGVDEVAREEVSHIVATSVEALQAGRPLPVAASSADVALVKAARTPAPTPARAETPRPLWLAAGLGAGVAHEGAGQLALPMASVSLLVGSESRRWEPALWLAVGAFSSDAGGDPVALRFHGGELAALAAIGTGGADAGTSRRVVARLGLGPGVELRAVTPTAAAGMPGVMLDASRVDPTFFVRAAARLEVRVYGPVGIFVAAACDARVVSHRYMLDRDGIPQAVFQPDFLRPTIVLGVDARLAGEAAP
jgi:hypothetical protein